MADDGDDRIAVVGGGPAGLAAAELLAGAGLPVTVYERMPSLGRKLLIAGRGGLNLTHSEALPAFLARYHPAEPRLAAAIEAFPPEALRDWCEGLGQPTFVGSSGRVFPRSFKASPLLRAWLARLAGLGVSLRPRHRLVAWDAEALTFATPEGAIACRPRAVLLALGGASWPRLGSDGAWVPLLEEGGVPVSPLTPANVGFTVPWSAHMAERFAGAPLKRVGFAFEGTRLLGEAVVTAEGIEGGAIYALSRPIREAIAREGAACLTLDLRPDLDRDTLAARLAAGKAGQSASNRLRKGAGLDPVAAALLREAHGVALPSEAKALARCIKAAPLRLTGPRPIARAISTAGGVAFAGLDARFMLRSRPGTFVAGEMLDWEAPTGGYLLQASFATGRAAAAGLIGWLGERGWSRNPSMTER
ncbi:TIGR03862 family flavoprotein [Methylobacterium organophilum]|uniref:3-dehydro-bile acid delta(4,6)-reductase n=1 Tax=Methylobacterium organophilum TaxID=410 RepID=A0ABQ4TAJ0_METOR|nr:TIGR03862 family flavoprotein [Methylobacterium organophilum]GJE28061.1 3-dehydro-bile acid delta(4,6)-reductase [Methylobacterium organophilum]